LTKPLVRSMISTLEKWSKSVATPAANKKIQFPHDQQVEIVSKTHFSPLCQCIPAGIRFLEQSHADVVSETGESTKPTNHRHGRLQIPRRVGSGSSWSRILQLWILSKSDWCWHKKWPKDIWQKSSDNRVILKKFVCFTPSVFSDLARGKKKNVSFDGKLPCGRHFGSDASSYASEHDILTGIHWYLVPTK
jgi:hypothetical protein